MENWCLVDTKILFALIKIQHQSAIIDNRVSRAVFTAIMKSSARVHKPCETTRLQTTVFFITFFSFLTTYFEKISQRKKNCLVRVNDRFPLFLKIEIVWIILSAGFPALSISWCSFLFVLHATVIWWQVPLEIVLIWLFRYTVHRTASRAPCPSICGRCSISTLFLVLMLGILYVL